MSVETDLDLEMETGNSFLDELLSFVEESEVEELDMSNVKEGFSVQSMDQANYIAKKVKELRAEQEEAAEIAKAQVKAYQEKVEAWLNSVSNPLVNQEEFYLQLLEDFASQKLEGSSKKSLKLIEGTLQFRKQSDQYEYEENVLLTAVQEGFTDYVKVKETVDKTKLKKDGKVKDGELYLEDKLVQGVSVTPREDKFDVK